MKRLSILFIISILIFSAGCGSAAESAPATGSSVRSDNRDSQSSSDNQEILSASKDIFAMDTYMTVTCYGERCEEALNAAEEEIRRLDNLLSVGNENSEISVLNRSGNAVLSDDSTIMVEKSLEIASQTDGFFDITVYPLMDLWGFTTQNFSLPDEAELNSTMESIGSDKIRFDSDTKQIELEQGMGIDLGGIAKGYCSDRLMEIFQEYDLVSGLISLGGNVQCYHTKPDGSLWRCGIRNPFDPDNMSNLIGIVSVSDCAVITSGAYERFFTGEDGQIYHHILDPHTGYPANQGLVSVTIVSSEGILADALSTACYAMGLEKSEQYWQEYGDHFDMILVTDSGDVYITEALQDHFKTEAPLHIITR